MEGEEQLKLFVWEKFSPDYSDGLAFAIAKYEHQARALVVLRRGYPVYEWGPVKVFDLDRPIAFQQPGGS